jgi:hypothetical protein
MTAWETNLLNVIYLYHMYITTAQNGVMQSVILSTKKYIFISTRDYQKCSLNYPLQTKQGVEMAS